MTDLKITRISNRKIAMLVFAIFAGFNIVCAQNDNGIALSWLSKSAPETACGISWGVPFFNGDVQANSSFVLKNEKGVEKPLQSWPLAYWPDGSLKWVGFSTVANAEDGLTFYLQQQNNAEISETSKKILVSEDQNSIHINTGTLKCKIPRSGPFLIDEMTIDGRVVAEKGKLVCTLEDRSLQETKRIMSYRDFESSVKKVTLEQNGPMRTVVKIEGVHAALNGDREWLPFCVRLYFFAGIEKVKMVHTIVFDGNEQEDFISALGLTFLVPMREEIQNRTVRFGGEKGGLWSEPIQPLIGRGGRYISEPDSRKDVYGKQIAGQKVQNKNEVNNREKNLLEKWAIWDDFRLIQPNADGFTIEKRTNSKSSWLASGAGKRASGLVFAGDVSGGLAVGMKDFWQSYPSALEVQNASSDEAKLNVWFWSPFSNPMDLRHYDTIAHGLEEVYEDVQPGFSTPHGIGRTHELLLIPSAHIPEKTISAAHQNESENPPLLVCSPEYLHRVKAFGIWSLPDSSTPFKKAIEENLDGIISYYQKAIEQHNWYGFWNFGDVMHSYDNTRHVWRYDLGGMAWDNSELGTDLWLWYSFLRTGREDIFKMAAAMTRHTGEVDMYHLGKFAGLGSRHNVSHWGCGAKEARISQAFYRRFMYYLTTDERIGDIMHEVADVDYKAAVEYDPMRLASPKTADQEKYPGRLRLGPDWLALVGNWMTEWERTGDVKYRNKIIAGMNCISEMPFGIRSGKDLLMGYDPADSKLYQLTDIAGDYNLATIMGGGELVFELNEYIEHEGWLKDWMQFCRLTKAPKEILLKDKKTGTEGEDASMSRGDRLAAYVYYKTKNKAFAEPAIRNISRMLWWGAFETQNIDGADVLNAVDESPYLGTNDAAQSGLMAIEVLEMCKDQLPENVPEKPDFTKPGRK